MKKSFLNLIYNRKLNKEKIRTKFLIFQRLAGLCGVGGHMRPQPLSQLLGTSEKTRSLLSRPKMVGLESIRTGVRYH